jgi:dolichyl-phosphate-mannose-protein mannosyltransferase
VWLLVVIVVLSGGVRAWGTFEERGYTEDEPLHVPSAISLGTYGTTTSMSWIHPPLSGLMLYASIRALGDNPHGWRMVDVVLGTGSVLLVWLVGLRLFPGSGAGLVAAALLGLDPFHAYFSRTTFQEIPATFFFLAFVWAILEYTERGRRTLPLAGVALGLTVATKAYFVLAIPLVVAYAAYRALRRGEPRTRVALDVLLTQAVLPASILLLCYAPWFGRGFTIPDFVQLNVDALRTLRSYRIEEFLNRDLIEAGGKPWEWFLKPILLGRRELLGDGATGRFALEINNPPFRLLVLPSVALVAVHGVRERSAAELLVPALFAAVYALFLGAGRPMFSYSALAVLPLAYLMVARAALLLAERRGQARRWQAVLLGAAVAWGLYTFPLISRRTVPLAVYRPLLAVTRFVDGT